MGGRKYLMRLQCYCIVGSCLVRAHCWFGRVGRKDHKDGYHSLGDDSGVESVECTCFDFRHIALAIHEFPLEVKELVMEGVLANSQDVCPVAGEEVYPDTPAADNEKGHGLVENESGGCRHLAKVSRCHV